MKGAASHAVWWLGAVSWMESTDLVSRSETTTRRDDYNPAALRGSWRTPSFMRASEGSV